MFHLNDSNAWMGKGLTEGLLLLLDPLITKTVATGIN